MNPIISPMIFYLIDLLGRLKHLAIVALALSICVFVITFCETEINDPEQYGEGKACVIKKMLRYSAIGLGISALVIMTLPSETAMYKMLAASYATPDNIAAVQGNVVDFVGKIAEAIAKARK